MARKNITEQMFDAIITAHFAYGKKASAIALETGLSEKSVLNACRVFKKMRDGQHEEVARNLLADGSISEKAIYWSAKRVGVDVPEVITSAIEERNKARQDKKETPIVEEKKPKIAQTNEQLYFIRLLQEVEKQNELFEQLLDVVFPKWFSDLKDNINANSDILSERVKKCEETLEAIKCNTRKRGQ